jgi:predicted nucleic acid-binding protein
VSLRFLADTSAIARKMQDLFGDRSQHNGPSVVDLLVAVTADRSRLTVLHDDHDFPVISRVVGVPVQPVVD